MFNHANSLLKFSFAHLLIATCLVGCSVDEPVDAGDPCPTNKDGVLEYIGNTSCTQTNATDCSFENRTYNYKDYFEIKSCPLEFAKCNKLANSTTYYCSDKCEEDSVRRGNTCINPSDNTTCGASNDYAGLDCTPTNRECVYDNEKGYSCSEKCTADTVRYGNTCLNPSDNTTCDASKTHPGIDCTQTGQSCYKSAEGAYACTAVSTSCTNGQQDPDEDAVDCGGSCAPCKTCIQHTDCTTGFCDVAKGFVCSKKCQSDDDCLNDGDVCREDGRCAPAIFEAVISINTTNTTVSLPHNESFLYNYQILWGDEDKLVKIEDTKRYDKIEETGITHTYKKAGQYTVRILGKFYWEVLSDTGTINTKKLDESIQSTVNPYLKEVHSYGTVFFGKYAFYGTTNLTHLPSDEVPLLKTSDLSYWFAKTGNIDGIVVMDTSRVENMVGLFKASTFNQPLMFDTSNVTNMNSMFASATFFNQKLPESFNTSNVKNMGSMFAYATNYNQPLPNSFDTSKVTNMNSMFASATNYNQPLPDSFNTSNVTDMGSMFSSATNYNQPLPDSFDTSNVIYMGSMFEHAKNYNQPLPKSFNTTNVEDLTAMFANATSYNQPLPESFDTSNVIYMFRMFDNATSYNQPLPKSFNTAKTENMMRMFYSASSFDQDISNFIFMEECDIDNMLEETKMSKENYCKVLEKYMADTEILHPDLGLGNYEVVCK